MNQLKKYLGLLWMALAPCIMIFVLWQAIAKIGDANEVARANTLLQWSIILLIFLPISAGLYLFGWYAWQDEYAHLPESSEEL